MPGVFRWPRVNAINRAQALRYLLYAAGEVLLIFIGITLAVAFENSSEQRRKDQFAREILAAIQRNLAANVTQLDDNIIWDESVLSSLDPVLNHLSNAMPWTNALGSDLEHAMHWSSPFLSTSAYESLIQNGLQLVTDELLRDEIVHLHESTYGLLIGEVDRLQWIFKEAVMLPLQSRELVRLDDGGTTTGLLVPRDYEASIRNGQLRTMFLEHQTNLLIGLELRREARAETLAVSENIERFLSANP